MVNFDIINTWCTYRTGIYFEVYSMFIESVLCILSIGAILLLGSMDHPHGTYLLYLILKLFVDFVLLRMCNVV